MILDALTRFNLPVDKLRGQCYDGTSSMSGQFKGVRARLQAVQPKALFVHCFTHSLNLCIQDAVRSVPLLRYVMLYLHDLSSVVRGSAKRKQAVIDIVQAVDKENPALPRPLCPTRCAVPFAAINAAVKSYSVVIDFLNEVVHMTTADDSTVKAGGLARHFESGETYLAHLVAKEVFALMDSLSIVLQSSAISVTGAVEAVTVTLEQLQKLRSDENIMQLWNDVQLKISDYSLSQLQLPRHIRRPR